MLGAISMSRVVIFNSRCFGEMKTLSTKVCTFIKMASIKRFWLIFIFKQNI